MSAETASPKPKVRKAIGPRLRIVYNIVLTLLAILVANSVYLAGVTFVEWVSGKTYQDFFYICMFLGHLILGLLFVVPFIIFGVVHMLNTKNRKIRRTVNIGYALFAISIAILISGFLLVRVGSFNLSDPTARSAVYWLHVGCPLVAGWLYWLHRLVGPKIRWKAGLAYASVAGIVALGMVALQAQDPRDWNQAGPKDGEQYFHPSPARTVTGNFIPADVLDMNEYCLKCHEEVHGDWADSSHRFSSFNNPPYFASVAETREVAMERDGNVQAARWCAGCHDPVPFFSGAFDDPDFDMVNHPTAHAGITCTVCHAITHVNSTEGNADYTIDEPVHYPFAQSENVLLQWINNQLVKAKPSLHKKTFLKPLHSQPEFCSTCHKVSLPFELNHYKDFLRGQNHWDPWLLSGVSGHGSRSFYYPPKSQDCNDCHMQLKVSDEFGADYFDDSGKRKLHNHQFPSANTGVAWLRGSDKAIKAHEEYLQDVVRVDIFGIRKGGTVDGELIAPLRPEMPELEPGESYLIENVVRTLKLGHLFTQGTTDSNQIWLDVTVKSGDRVIGRSGEMDEEKIVDPWSHFINTFMLDKDGNRINRRNAQDIFVPLYTHQIPPGAADSVHYKLDVPADVDAPITIDVKLKYRKFDTELMRFVAEKNAKYGAPIRGYEEGKPYENNLPIVTLAADSITLPVAGIDSNVDNAKNGIPEWQRWNDYGIGLYLNGPRPSRAELKQANAAFREVEKLGRYDGPLNLARSLFLEAGPGQLDEAVEAIQRASAFKEPAAPPWTVAVLSGQVNRQQGRFDDAEANFRQVVGDQPTERTERGFDFSKDYVVLNMLGQTLFDQAKRIRGQQRKDEREAKLNEAIGVFKKTLAIDSENIEAHYTLQQLYSQLGDAENGSIHRKLHQRYKLDDTARGRATRLAKEKYPAANAASEAIVIYDLSRNLK
jgi:tetratricopeptide (TPR) repeat protein